MNRNALDQYGLPLRPYVPLAYSEKRYALYGNLSNSNPAMPGSGRYATYDFSAQQIPGPQEDGPQTVEQLVTQGYFSVPDSDPETAIIGDKRHTAWLGLDDAICQIRKRYEIYLVNLYEIELAKCEAVNEFFECEFEQGGFANEHQRKTLAGRLQELYSDQRSERITLWKDISGLRRALPESAQQYLAAYRKLAILSGERGDSA